ncbi:MAG TPA: ATP-binding cassette domain-containing protein [Candidatus Nanoarchaeia archaeon]|nr:ATP-binding cassette domain-containing protein [Candidatus Nanoarchaeia archaeon]
MSNAIVARGLTKRYGDFLAVDSISFEVNQGEIFGFLGPNGAGKTTTTKMLIGQTKPTSGTINVAGKDMIHQSVEAKASVGVVPENSNVYDEMSAWDNLIFAGQLYKVSREKRENKAKELLELFGLYERRKDRAGIFSRGLKRRLTIAAALVHSPNIIFLDEPTSGLDVQSSRMIRKLVKDLNESGVTVFLTTHYIEEADQLCQRVAMINKGKIVALDAPQKLKSSVEKHKIIEISFDQKINLENKLANLTDVENVTQFGDKFRLHYKSIFSDALPLLADFAKENNLRIVSVNTLSPSLEDVFVQLTGLNVEIMKVEKEQGKKAANLG